MLFSLLIQKCHIFMSTSTAFTEYPMRGAKYVRLFQTNKLTKTVNKKSFRAQVNSNRSGKINTRGTLKKIRI